MSRCCWWWLHLAFPHRSNRVLLETTMQVTHTPSQSSAYAVWILNELFMNEWETGYYDTSSFSVPFCLFRWYGTLFLGSAYCNSQHSKELRFTRGEKRSALKPVTSKAETKKLTILLAPFNIYIYFLCDAVFSHPQSRLLVSLPLGRRRRRVFLSFNFATIFYANEIHHKISWICICICFFPSHRLSPFSRARFSVSLYLVITLWFFWLHCILRSICRFALFWGHWFHFGFYARFSLRSLSFHTEHISRSSGTSFSSLKHTINFHEIIFDKFVYTTDKW